MNKPNIRFETTRTDWILEVITLIGLLMMALLVLISYDALPEIIPRHYTGNGQPDGYGEKSLLFIVPATAMVLYAAMTVASRYPNKLNFPVTITPENASKQYTNLIRMLRITKMLVVLISLYLTFVTIQVSLGKMQGLGKWFLLLTILLFLGTIGIFMWRGFRMS